LLNVDRQSEQKTTDFGPNLKKFSHIFLHAGIIASGDKEGAHIIYGNSSSLAFGFRKKYKISPIYSLGYDLENQYTFYKLKQESGKVLPDTIINNIAGRLDYSSLELGLFNRFNLDPERGNFLGHFIDVGIMGEWDYSIRCISKNELSDGTTIKSVVKKLKYVYNLNTKIYARLGFSHLSLLASYRLKPLFKPGWSYPDLPRLILGLELAVF
jgi:hypothetical protein